MIFWTYWDVNRYTKQLIGNKLEDVVIDEAIKHRADQRWFVKASGYLIAIIMFAGVYILADKHHYLVALVMLIVASLLVIASVLIIGVKEYFLNEDILFEEDKRKSSSKVGTKQAQQLIRLYRRYKIALILLTISLVVPCLFYLWVAYELSIH
ncbi:hypothetical protein [Vagococcus zengguangii]|nr:hypothetical protein [Vagococcus zengguangii]